MAYNVAANMQPVNFIGNMLAARQQEIGNSLAQREMGMREQNALMQRQQFDAQNQQRQAAQKEQEQAATREWVINGAKHLASAKSEQEFAMLADRYASDPRTQQLGITRDQITPDGVSQILMAAGGSPVERQVPFEQSEAYKMEQVKAVNARKLEQLRQSGRGGADAPSGYQWANGALAPIPGGPADPQGPAAKKQVAPLRKEFRSLESVKAYETIVPLIKSAAKAPDSGYGDLQLIYTVGKILDPGSVVREGELALTIKAGTMMSQLFGAGRFQLGKGGRIPPAQRQQIMEMLKERSGEYKNMYDRDYQTYTQYAEGSGISPYEVVGAHPDGESGSGRGAVPSVGEVVDGYRFKGGDPSKQASWEQVR